ERVRGRDELRRKLHALGVGARLLHFEVLARAIAESTERIDEEATRGEVSDGLLDALSALFAKMPELAWAKTTAATPPPSHEVEPMPSVAPPTMPWTVVAVGEEAMANALAADPAVFSCEVEGTDDVAAALDLARTVAPELIVIDSDLEGIEALVEALVEDPLTMPVPIIAFGKADAEATARLQAIGVARVVSKADSATELRAVCAAVIAGARASAQSALQELGAMSVKQLVERIGDEVRRALLDEVDPHTSDVKVSLGVGAEILGPIWGALARVRDVVEAKSHGTVAFPGARERTRGPVAVASALALVDREAEVPQSASEPPPDAHKPRRPRQRTSEAAVDLGARIIVVADDDPQVVWFIADVLKGEGALVLEAKDGGEALALARGSGADAIITDVLMPHVDGLTLARILRRDVALRDRPIVLLSWKEDLLKRLRDLRMDANAMLRKEADARTILARVREILAPRMRVEARIAGEGEVRGRLDELSVASLLEITNRVRREASIVVRDAANVFEVELDGGGIRSASRASIDGHLASGLDILPSLLGVVGGRFLVRGLPEVAASPRTLEGDLTQQLSPVLRRIRAACDAVSGARTIELVDVGLEPSLLAAYLDATPGPVRKLLERLAAGGSPRGMVLGGEVAPATLEDVLLDVASRGIIVRAQGAKGEDLLALADKALDLAPTPLIDETAKNAPAPQAEFSFATSIAPPAVKPEPEVAADGASPGSLADAVLSSTGEKRSSSKPIIDMRELKPRSVPTRSDPPGPGERTSAPPPKEFSATPTPAVPEVATAKIEEPDLRTSTLAGVGASDVAKLGTMPPPTRTIPLGLTPPPMPAMPAEKTPDPAPAEPAPAPAAAATPTDQATPTPEPRDKIL
ncbi:MAG: response regulator, partial [Polyangiales bacterium]